MHGSGFYRHFPYDIEIEQALLGAILENNGAVANVADSLEAEHFYDPLHQRLYEAMASSVERGDVIVTPLTLHAMMKNDPGLVEVGGQAYLDGLAKAAPALPNVRDFARILHDLFVRRALIRVGEDIVNAAYDAPHVKSPASQLEAGESALRTIWENEARLFSGSRPAALTAAEWLERDIPPPDHLMGEVLSTTSRMMLVAPTGLGKTNFTLQLGAATAAGTGFLHWRSPRPSRVLFVDGEMSRRLMRTRVIDATRRHGGIPSGLVILSRDDVPDMPPFNTVAGQRFIDREIDRIGGADLVIFDNVQALLEGDMKDEESWQQTLPWIKKLTSRSIGQIWVHHTGINQTRSYGTSTREWQLDTVLLLEKLEGANTDIAFTLKFLKARERAPHNRDDFAEAVVTLQNDQWHVDVESGVRAKPISLTRGENAWFLDLVDIFAEPESPIISLSPASGMTQVKTLARDHIRDRFKQKGKFTLDTDGNLTGGDRQKMSTALNALKDKGKIGMTERVVWLMEARQ